MRRGSEGAGGTVSDPGVTLRRISADVDAAWPETRRRRGARRSGGEERKRQKEAVREYEGACGAGHREQEAPYQTQV